MSSLPLPLTPVAGLSDEELVDRVRLGDENAFAELHARYEPRLLRYSRRVLGSSHNLAEDVVQEALWRAHRALRRDDRPIALRPWLYRLVRNCCLDELARGRNDALDLHALAEEPPAPNADPSVVAEQRRRTRDLLGDLAALPTDQRHAILRREVDGLSHAALARELGLSEQATRSLVHRGRKNLVKAAEARDTACEEVRADLDVALDEGRRATARTYRHLAACRACRSYRAELRRVGSTLRLLNPLPLLGLAGLITFGKSGGAIKVGGATAATAVIAGGAFGLDVLGPGEMSPVSVRTPVVAGGLDRGEPLPFGTAIATRRVAVPAEGATAARIRVTCPAGTTAAELLPAQPPAISHGMTTVPGTTRTAVVRIAGDHAVRRATVRVLCKRPDARGSLLAAPLPLSAGTTTTLCGDRAYLLRSPGGRVTGSAFGSQPLAVVDRRGGWAKVRADSGESGWLRAQSLCVSSRR